ncbi:hypothetical protein FHR32_007326 [Streptosporangium album]|uniref:Uncharacterized protein n=1 Tax=Streptosporangium album TaxID=47479 RepID=A0A7W7S4R1_9ACTN|nr:hypothetical protein [Streptosporangium album]MBB4942926.1 hypothetical protein [Streptosporangium album]
MNELDDLIVSLRPDTDDAYQRRCESDLARAFATPRRRSISRRPRRRPAQRHHPRDPARGP